MTHRLSIGYSPCPNDTFIFYALAHNRIPLQHTAFATPVLDDVETLNRWALQGKLDVTKLSFNALGHVLDRYVMLTAGAALGRGCGPLLVAKPGQRKALEGALIAIPGEYTTAAMLLKLFAPGADHLQVMRFEQIMEAVVRDVVDYGVIIHESRFTYPGFGLECVQDLGQWWEELTGLPIPLGCIAARRELSETILREIDQGIRESLLWARAHPDRCLDYIRQHAQEMNEAVLNSHISLYVNDFSLNIGPGGKAAVEELLGRGRAAGIFPAETASGWCLQ